MEMLAYGRSPAGVLVASPLLMALQMRAEDALETASAEIFTGEHGCQGASSNLIADAVSCFVFRVSCKFHSWHHLYALHEGVPPINVRNAPVEPNPADFSVSLVTMFLPSSFWNSALAVPLKQVQHESTSRNCSPERVCQSKRGWMQCATPAQLFRATLREAAGRWEGMKGDRVVQELVHVFHPKLGPEDEELLSSWLTGRSSASGVPCFVADRLHYNLYIIV